MNENFPTESNEAKRLQSNSMEAGDPGCEGESTEPVKNKKGELRSSRQDQINRHAQLHLEREYQSENQIEIFKSEQLEETNRQIKKLKKSLEKIAKEKNQLIRELKANNEILAKCQETTSQIANRNLERFALQPAIEVVDLLSNFIEEIACHQALEAENNCPLLYSLKQLIRQAEKIAREKREYLGLVKIQPEEMDDLDPQKHQIKGAVDTTDKDRHKKIEKTLTAGLIYKDKVLKQARVCVYRFKG